MISKMAADGSNPSLAKKKRSLPGTPDPEAEVIALSPKTLMATKRFVCEICGKGFQRDQNLQLHRRGHNLPWKLKQRSNKEAKKRVYVCPETSCVHHHPSRALGDLTGIKKHFCRKHGEKKWKCEKCSKSYAVQSDWKAHSKTCGTREYKCDCGTLFSRRDSFISHRAFCDALAEEAARVSNAMAQHWVMYCDPVCQNPAVGDYYSHQLQEVNQTHMGTMSATALLQKAAEIGAISSPGHSVILEEGFLFNNGSEFCNSGTTNPIVVIGNENEMYTAKRRRTQSEVECGATGAAGLTRDFLGVGAQTLCHSSPTIKEWI
ncbi:zinc finger protein MAGPIE-like [Cucurbita moschata]|uniref:Zinc finger protein MAGPIE-like n=1 Tax=Cucurbita moschata TaxID=3662 RepID=A0A6J1FV86_CUCMO|nr:zinc finger protein MAGPIE-like [Cucurbita moschata]